MRFLRNILNSIIKSSKHGDTEQVSHINVALVGKPNSGKTALFNSLTGSKQRVANYAGVTVSKKHGSLISPNGKVFEIIDLPGTYSLRSRSPDELITKNVLLGQSKDELSIDIILAVVDATNLELSLRLVQELNKLGLPIIIALNMHDLAIKQGITIDVPKLEKLLGCKVIPTVSIKKFGLLNLVKILETIKPIKTTNTWNAGTIDSIKIESAIVKDIISQAVTSKQAKVSITEKIDKILLHPIGGLVILFSILFMLFQAVFSWATVPQDMLQSFFDNSKEYVIALAPHSMVLNLIGNGIIAGVGQSIVFLPQILTLYLLITILEDSGYMARAAFLLDKIMGSAGLHGRAFIPLLSSFACAIPGIMSTRTIENKNDRLITILIAPLMTCSARIPIYTLLISAFIPAKSIAGFNLQGLVMFGLYAIGIIFGLAVALILKVFFFKGPRQTLLLELPGYKIPNMKNIIMEVIKPAKSFITRAGTIILYIMIILWFLCTFPHPSIIGSDIAIKYSFAGMIGSFIEPIFRPIGFNWQIVIALIPGMAAREVAVSALGTIYAVSGSGDIVASNLTKILPHVWSIATAMSLITWYIFAPQCISTLATAKRETNSWKLPIIMFTYQILLAYIMSLLVYQLCTHFL